MDPRHWQIGSQAVLLTFGLLFLDFEVSLPQVAVTLGASLLTQALCTRVWRLPAFEPRSALISGLSLALLLRTNHLWVAGLAAALAVASKFVLALPQADGGGRKHIWNPSCFAIVLALASGLAWVSPGQWGNAAWLGFLVASLGGSVLRRTERGDVTVAFAVAWCLLIFGRAWWVGDPWTIPVHRLQSGSLLLFTFFMISDPRTIPDSRPMRVLFACAVALLGFWIQYLQFRTNGLLWSLFLLAPAVPLLDRVTRAPAFRWPTLSTPLPARSVA